MILPCWKPLLHIMKESWMEKEIVENEVKGKRSILILQLGSNAQEVCGKAEV